MHTLQGHLRAGQDAKHHQTRLFFITVPGVERGVVQILALGTEAIRLVLLNGIHCASRTGKGEAGTRRQEMSSPRAKALVFCNVVDFALWYGMMVDVKMLFCRGAA